MRLTVYILTFFVCCSVRCLAVSDISSTDECKQLLKKGNEAFNEDRFDIALDLYTKCLELADINGDITNYTSALGSIGNLYGLFQDYDRAAYYFEKGYKASLQQDQRLQSIFLTNLVMCCSYAGNAEKTHTYYDKLQQLPEWDPQLSPYYQCVCKTALAIIDKNYEEALISTRDGLEVSRRLQLGIPYDLSQEEDFGKIYEKMGQNDSAIVHFSTIVKQGGHKGCVELRQSAYQHLTHIYAVIGDSIRSKEYANLAIMLRDTLQHGKQMHAALNRLFAYEKRANDKEVMSLHKTINRQWFFVGFCILVVVLLVTLSLIAVSKNRNLNSAYRLLVEKNKEQIRSMERERALRDKKLQSSPIEIKVDEEIISDPLDPIETEDKQENSSDTPVLSLLQVRQLQEEIDAVMCDARNFSNPDFSLALLANLVDSNTKYVSYVINKSYQKNFKTYLNEFRIREASRKLSDPQYANLTIQAIAEMVGFNSPNTFIIAFKKLIGMTPSVYQKLAKENQR